jgi:hypothetical protein
VSAAVEDILFRSVCIRGRMSFVSRLRFPTNTPPVVPEPLGREPPKHLTEPGDPLGHSVRLLDEKPTLSGPTLEGKSATEEQLPEPMRSGSGPKIVNPLRKHASLLTMHKQTDGGFPRIGDLGAS